MGQKIPGVCPYDLCTDDRTRHMEKGPCRLCAHTGAHTGVRCYRTQENSVGSPQEGSQGQVMKELLNGFWEGLELT